MPHLGAFVPSNYFAFIYVPVYSTAEEEEMVSNLDESLARGVRTIFDQNSWLLAIFATSRAQKRLSTFHRSDP